MVNPRDTAGERRKKERMNGISQAPSVVEIYHFGPIPRKRNCTSSASSPFFPGLSPGFTILGEIFFAYVTDLKTTTTTATTTIEAVTFRLRRCCMLGMFFDADILGHECRIF